MVKNVSTPSSLQQLWVLLVILLLHEFGNDTLTFFESRPPIAIIDLLTLASELYHGRK